MHINLEKTEEHAIQAYSNHQIQVNSICYTDSVIVSQQEIITNVSIHHIQEIEEHYISLLLKHQPEIIIIGHQESGIPPMKWIALMSQQGIGMEFMSIGAACRTYNILLSEARTVVVGILLSGL